MPPDYLQQRSRVEEFAERYLTFVEGEKAGQPLVLAPWQQDLLRRIYNDVDEDGKRKVRRVYVSVPKKSGKSTGLGAPIALYHLFCDPEPRAQIFCAAPVASRARVIFDIAKAMVEASPTLRQKATIRQNSITYKDRSFRTLNNNANRAHGPSISVLIMDEIHALETQGDREFYEALTHAQGARREPLTVLLSTAGYDSQSLCGEIDQYAQKVSSGVVEDPTFLGCIHRADPEDDWQDPETWRKANPSLGIAVYEDFYREKANDAQGSPVLVLAFQRWLLNQWVENHAQYITTPDWDACALAVDPDELEGRECYGGLEMSTRTDLSAFVLTFPPEERRDRPRVHREEDS